MNKKKDDKEIDESKVNRRRRTIKKQTENEFQDQIKTNTDKSKKEPKKSNNKSDPKKSDNKAEPKKSDKNSESTKKSTKNDSKSKTQTKTDEFFPEILAQNAIRISQNGVQKCLISKKGALSCFWLKSDKKWTVFTPEGFESKTTDVSVGNIITCAINKVGVICWRTSY